MKIITLLPVKNESWILRSTLKNFSDFSDHIIVADQNSTDGSLEIYKEFEKVVVIKNDNIGHSNSVRWQLLDYARKMFGTRNIVVCIDADEMILPEAIKQIKTLVDRKTQSVSFSFPWIQLWGGIKKYRSDYAWKNNYKTVAFFDDGLVDYERKKVINDHTDRIPQCKNIITFNQFPLLHYQYVIIKQAEIKQVWYQCSELINRFEPKKINYKYSFTKNAKSITLADSKNDWFSNLSQVSTGYNLEKDWRYKEILNWFEQYGIEYFETLQIWNIEEFNDRFVKKTGKTPKPEIFPVWIIKLNNIRNKLRNLF